MAAARLLKKAPELVLGTGLYDEFAARLWRAVDRLKAGSGFEEGVTQGPLIDMKAVEKVEEHVQDAVKKGATSVEMMPVLMPMMPYSTCSATRQTLPMSRL